MGRYRFLGHRPRAARSECVSHAEAISRQPAYAIEPDAPLSDAVRLMDERNATHLVVVDRERPVGVISTLDVAGAAAWGRK
jgi:CBS domain-containing protein